MRVPKAVLPLSALLLLFCLPVSAQRGGGSGMIQVVTIRGRVVDGDTGSSVLDARISLVGMAGGASNGSQSYMGSDFVFENIPTGLYEIVIEATGYQTLRQPMQTSSAMSSYITIPMRKIRAPRDVPAGKTVSSRLLQLPAPAREAYQNGISELYDKHDPEKSLPFFQKTLKLAPSFYEANYELGMAYQTLKRAPEALAAFREADKASAGKFAPAEIALASMLSEQQNYTGAEAAARHGLESEPKSATAHYELARALLGQGKTAEAETEAKASLEQSRDLPQNYLVLAAVSANRGETVDAIQDLDEYLKVVPSGPMSDSVRTLRDTLSKQAPQAKEGASASATPPAKP